jgi:hypothetical protein
VIAVGACLPESLAAQIDDVRLDLADILVIEIQPIDDSRPEVLRDDVRILEQLSDELAARFGLQVDSEAALVSVDLVEAGNAVDVSPDRPHEVQVLLRFDLDDVGPHLSEGLDAVGDDASGAEADHSDSR